MSDSDSDSKSTSPDSASAAQEVHLVLLLHGLYGSPANLWCLEDEIKQAHDQSSCGLELAILVAGGYAGAQTWDGIDVNAHRVAEELDAEIERLTDMGKRVTLFSITGYSLGGLIARTLIGELYARSPSFFDLHRPASFCTIATPHLGVLRYGSWRSTWLHAVGRRLFSRTGQQLYCLDKDEGRPLLGLLADPALIYYKALSQFPRVTIVANAINDLTVPYPTAAIVTHDPFIDHERTSLRVELEGKTIKEYYRPDPETEEVEDLVTVDQDRTSAPAPIPGLRRPSLPPVFFLPWKPFRYALIPFLPVIIPTLLTIIALTFAFHSFQSAQRIRSHISGRTGERRRLLLGLTDDTPLGSPGETADVTPVETPRAGTPTTAFQTDIEAGIGTTEMAAAAASNSIPGSDTVANAAGALAQASKDSQPILSSEQRAMVDNLSTIPQLERVVAWFPNAFNAHAVIIARNARHPKWAWQSEGRSVVRTWARRVIQAATGEEFEPQID